MLNTQPANHQASPDGLLVDQLVAILRDTHDHGACVQALRDADPDTFVGVDTRSTCTWVAVRAYRAFVSRDGGPRTLWTVERGFAQQLFRSGEAVAA